MASALPDAFGGCIGGGGLLSTLPSNLTVAVDQPRFAGAVVVTPVEVFAAMRFAFTHLEVAVEPGGGHVGPAAIAQALAA